MVIGRFAPTPSGRMHIGNVYAMLGAWLSARAGGPERTSRTGGGAGDADCLNNVNRVDGMSGAADPGDADGGRGRMLLRIEDIDTPRVLPDADRWIMDDLAWLGLDWDGEPVYQSRRLDIYEQALRALQSIDLRDAAAFGGRDGVDGTETTALIYPCFCSRADIRAASAPQEGDRFVMYPGTCRRALAEHPRQVEQRLANGDRHSLRIAMPVAGDARAVVTVHDRVFGNCRFDLPRDLGDTVVRRADGLFAYQLVVTVDDLLMGVDDIVRGRDLLRSAALQLYIRERLLDAGFGDSSDGGVAAAHRDIRFAHLPLIDNAAGRRLAKRERSLDMGTLRKHGVTAHQVIGYCAWLLGLQQEPEPCAAADLLHGFSWDALAADSQDRSIPDDPFSIGL